MPSASSALTPRTGAKTGRRFLVVDDNTDFVQTIGVLLEPTDIKSRSHLTAWPV